MADPRNQKQLRKDQSLVRDERAEALEGIVRGTPTKPLVKNVNRDEARGDSDRTGDHHDEDPNREE